MTAPSTKEVTTITAEPAKALYRVPEAMRLLSLSRTVIYQEIRAGRLHTVTRGRTRLVPATAITAYIALLEVETLKGAA